MLSTMMHSGKSLADEFQRIQNRPSVASAPPVLSLESFFGCQDLLWAAYAAGALHVDGPTIKRSAAWAAEVADGNSDEP